MKNIDSRSHVRGESIYVNDIPVQEDTLFGVVLGSPVAHGKVHGIDFSQALKMEGVEAVISAKDITGENQIGSIIQDEELFADKEVHFIGMPVALVCAKTEAIARKALAKIKVDIEELRPILTAREAHAEKKFISPSRTFKIGNTDATWKKCAHIIDGQAEMGGQEHVYLETQGAYAYMLENGAIKIHSSTQATKYVQVGAARVLGIPMHKIEVDTNRIGGGFGGKEDQATPWAAMTALAAYTLKKPVKLILERADDFTMTGKRHPYSFDFKLGLSKDLKILCYQVEGFQNAGAAADVSPAVMERTLFHGSGSYHIPNAKITCHSCRTNLAPNTAMRGFGAPQAMFALEAAIMKAAVTLNVSPMEIQGKNLLREGNRFPYDQIAENCNAGKCWDTAYKKFAVEKLKKEIKEFNKKNAHNKKGLSMFPLCFGISFTNTSLNQGRSLVHIYTDGSVSITTGVVEMGQGVNTKILQAAAKTLSISPRRFTIHSTNTTRIANASPTAASSGADLNGKATILACEALAARLKGVACRELKGRNPDKIEIKDEIVFHKGKKTSLTWGKLVLLADKARVPLSEHAHYATPKIHFNKSTEKGHPFAYHVYGTAVTVVTVDCLRGTYEIDLVKCVHDFGSSINLNIDIGQAEGAIVQGIGLMTIEELLVDQKGKHIYDTLSSYKIPDIYFAPKNVEVVPLATKPDELALLGSKAVGEPPLMYGIGSFFAILMAMREFNPKMKLQFWAPLTHQKCLLSLYENYGDLLK
ncbi:MAG: molybdopterin-dependent oxidoreductase [Candidatus Aminicenantes bacterium]|nr:molybdopterin-dependent oxidoreductase [Candidatus Aminicenantes bacterium]